MDITHNALLAILTPSRAPRPGRDARALDSRALNSGQFRRRSRPDTSRRTRGMGLETRAPGPFHGPLQSLLSRATKSELFGFAAGGLVLLAALFV